MRLYLHLKVTEFRSTEHTKVIVFVANNKLPCFRDPKTLAVHQTYMFNAPNPIWSINYLPDRTDMGRRML